LKKSVDKKVEKIKRIIQEKDFVIKKYHTKSTLEELIYSELILKKYAYTSIIIISDEPHTKRIDILIKNFTNFEKLGINYVLVGSNVKWWNKEKFYENKKAVYFSIHELLKILINYIIYSLEKLSILDQKDIENLNKYEHDLIKNLNFTIKRTINLFDNN